MGTTPGNAVNEATTGIAGFTGTGFTATAATQYNVLVGGATSSTLANVAPSATSGVPLVSAGASSNPAYGTAVVAGGGTGVTSVTTAPAATAFAGWDANKNLSANSFIGGYRTVATAAGTTTLVVGDAQQQYFTGSTTQTVVMPVTSTLVLGQTYVIVNNSSGVVTVQSSGTNTIQAMAASTILRLTVIDTAVTTAAGWYKEYDTQTSSSGVTGPGSSTDRAVATWNGTGGTALFDNSSVTISAAGEVTMTLQPKFCAAISSTNSNVTGDGTAATIIFDNAFQNIGSDYNAGTGIFTAAVTGFYLFTTNFTFSEIGVAHTSAVVTITTTTGGAATILTVNPSAIAVSGVYSCAGSVFIQLDASHTAKVVITVSGSTKTVDVPNGYNALFCGSLIN